MVNTKTYTILKDGEMLKELKSLAAAKKQADTEGAEVFCEGECVYTGRVFPAVEKITEEQKIPIQYTLTRLMNVRKEPSLSAAKLKVLEAGAVVEVAEIKDDWLCLTDGSFILYEDGRNATRN